MTDQLLLDVFSAPSHELTVRPGEAYIDEPIDGPIDVPATAPAAINLPADADVLDSGNALGLDLHVEKPPYCIPLMTEIVSRPRNGLTVVSTFSGCGGSCLGFKMAGYDVLWANEFIPAARETYAANHPGVLLDGTDIRQVDPRAILTAIGRERGDVDVLEGSPPCASFSMAGKREEGWGQVRKYSDTTQRVDDLFDEFLRVVVGLMPRVVVAENVSGLMYGTAHDYFAHILRQFSEIGYMALARILDAQWLGVPQARRRVIFVGVRRDLGLQPVFPAPLPYRYSLREALAFPEGTMIRGRRQRADGTWGEIEKDADGPGVTVNAMGYGSAAPHQVRILVENATGFAGRNGIRIDGEGHDYLDRSDEPAPAILARREIKVLGVSTNTGVRYQPKEGKPGYLLAGSPDEPARTVLASQGFGRMAAHFVNPITVQHNPSIERYAIGAEWATLRQGEQSEKYFNLIRPDENLPSPTVTQTGGNIGAASVTHPSEPRKFTIAELRRVCGFPDDFILTGTYQQQWERLGRAVPPPMMAAVAAAIRDGIFAKIGERG